MKKLLLLILFLIPLVSFGQSLVNLNSEHDIKNWLDKNASDPIEGIWIFSSKEMGAYSKTAILKLDGVKFTEIIIECYGEMIKNCETLGGFGAPVAKYSKMSSDGTYVVMEGEGSAVAILSGDTMEVEYSYEKVSAIKEYPLNTRSNDKVLKKSNFNEQFDDANAQKNNNTEILKELIVIETLRAENRITELSDFLDKYGYFSQDDYFVKFQPEKSIKLMLKITQDEKAGLIQVLYWDDKKHQIGNINKKELLSGWQMLINNSSIYSDKTSNKNQQPYGIFEDLKSKYKTEAKDEAKKIEFELLNKYEFRIKKNKDNVDSSWEYYLASNFTTMFSHKKSYVFSLLGLGKNERIDIIFPKHEDLGLNDKIPSPFFYVITNKLKSKYGLTDDTENLNVEFFMSLQNLNDRIWVDK